jgi:calcium-dependent protein kinase
MGNCAERRSSDEYYECCSTSLPPTTTTERAKVRALPTLLETAAVRALPTLLETAAIMRWSVGSLFEDEKGKRFEDVYRLGSSLGSGAFGKVYRCRARRYGGEFAAKCVRKNPESRRKEERKAAALALEEAVILRRLDHPNVIKLTHCFDSQSAVYLVLDLCEGGDLFDRLALEAPFVEPVAAKLTSQMLRAVAHLHERGVAHRDLKSENFLFERKGPMVGNVLKLVDFGLSAHFTPGDNTDTCFTKAVGTVNFVAPEVLQGAYGPKCDLWSAGAVLFCMLSGAFPFQGGQQEVIQRLRQNPNPDLHGQVWSSVSDPAKSLLRGLMDPSPVARFSAALALPHAWLSDPIKHVHPAGLGCY